jgi:hypothetical protein
MNKKTEITIEITFLVFIIFAISYLCLFIIKHDVNVYSLDLQWYNKSFIVGNGKIENKFYYFVYIEKWNNKKILKIPVEKCNIIKKDGTPKCEIDFLFKYKLIVPKETLIKDYEVF